MLTQPDRPAGRGRKVAMSPVKTLALAHRIAVEQPASLKTESAQAMLRGYDLDLLIVAAYGLILPQAVLEMPRLGCLNVHASLLPRWRGAAPIQRAILAGDQETGITLMQMDAGLDTGPMLIKATCPIGPAETAGELHDKLAGLGARTLIEALPAILHSTDEMPAPAPVAQPRDGVTYAARLEKAEARVDWSQPAAALDRLVRAFNPWPVAFTEPLPPEASASGQDSRKRLKGRLRIWRASVVAPPETNERPHEPGTVVKAEGKALWVATGDGILALNEVQAPGGKRLSAREFLNGGLIQLDDRFDSGGIADTVSPAVS